MAELVYSVRERGYRVVNDDKPHLRYYAGKWRCSGPFSLKHNLRYYPFPWGFGNTPAEAFVAWKQLQKRPPTPTMDEHAANLGAT